MITRAFLIALVAAGCASGARVDNQPASTVREPMDTISALNEVCEVLTRDPLSPTAAREALGRSGVAWVRTAPLVAVFATAPYLHNGSVPTLRALLDPASRRPATFPVGAAGFVLDTRLSGNRNSGHEFGTALSDGEKNDLIAFLKTL